MKQKDFPVSKKKILVTGGAGFIGSNFIKSICVRPEIKAEYHFIVLDLLTYAGFYPSIEKEINENDHLSFIQLDIREEGAVRKLFKEMDFDGVIHFAAESHVDRSIENPNIFLETNVLGTLNLLNASLERYGHNREFRYLQVSTDEVYGSLESNDQPFTEENSLRPNSPYSASKASGDLLARSYYMTFHLPVLITRCSNNYGPFQNPEKFIPLMIDKARNGQKLPVYGNGENIRDWIYVDDHNRGVWSVFRKGRPGEVYNLGGDCEKRNIDVAKMILSNLKRDESFLSFVKDRPGHDFRYAIDFNKAKIELNWSPEVPFDRGLEMTIQWYQQNQDWVNAVKDRTSVK